MIGVLKDEDIFAAGVCASESEGEFVGLGAGVDEIADAERRGEQRGEALRVAVGIVVEIASIGVEDGDLVLHRVNHTRMRVTHEGNVIVDVQESAAGVIEQILTPATNDFERVSVGDSEIFSEEGAARGESFVERGRGLRKIGSGNAEDEIGIGRKTQPDGTLGGKGNTGKIGGAIEKVENDLEMEMRRPAAIFSGVANVREDFAAGDALAGLERGESSSGKVAVEREEFDGGSRRVMKDDDGTVVEWRVIVRERMNCGIERGGNGSTGFGEKIDAEMDGAALGEGIRLVAEQWRGVQGAGFVVAAEADGSAGGAQDGSQLF
jgi:hypothetical protein